MTDLENSGTVAPVPAPAPSLGESQQRLLDALGDPVSLRILAALSGGDLDGHHLVVSTDLPQSSVYRKLRDLEANALIEVARLAFTPEGRKVEVFRSRIREVRIEFILGRVRVQVRRREDSADRLQELWSQVRAR